MSAERARKFVLPIGKHKGRTLGEVAAIDPPYLRWLLAECAACKGGFRRAVEFVVSRPEEVA